jgi:hypothetical protein
MQCVCGLEFNKFEHARHAAQCDAFWNTIYEEMRRIKRELLHPDVPVSTTDYMRWKSPGFPHVATLRAWQPWPEIQRNAGTGVYVRKPLEPRPHGRPGRPLKQPTLPEAPEHWHSLLEDGRCIAAEAPFECIVNMLVEMVHVAKAEADGHLGHYTNRLTDAEKQIVRLDAQEFLAEWGNASLHD